MKMRFLDGLILLCRKRQGELKEGFLRCPNIFLISVIRQKTQTREEF